jgi:hypothetical protein
VCKRRTGSGSGPVREVDLALAESRHARV